MAKAWTRAPRSIAAAFALAAAAASSCQIFAESNIGAGIGQPCSADDECQGARCVSGLCALECDSQAMCPEGSQCAGGLCQIPLKAGFIYVGEPAEAGWTLTHELGRRFVSEHLPYATTEFVSNAIVANQVAEAVDQLIASGNRVIIATSFTLREPMKAKAAQHPEAQFLTCSSNVTGPNLGTYFARSYQAWYLAGYAAAQKSKTKRLGFMGSYVTPEVVRHINAFTRGAQRYEPSVAVEVRWEGFWFDVDPPDPQTGKLDEEEITEQLIDSGCDVIAHNSDTGRPVKTVEDRRLGGQDVYSIGNDNEDACAVGPSSCIGAPFWNWGPLYVRIFEEIHRGTWNPLVPINDSIKVSASESVNTLSLNTAVAGSSLEIQVNELLADLAGPGGEGIPFLAGPERYCSTGQREACVEAGQTVSDEELATMCWFVEGLVERTNPADPTSPDKPATVPDGTAKVPSVPSYPLGSQTKPDCRVNQ